MNETQPVTPSIVGAGPTGWLKPDGTAGLRFLKPSVHEKHALVYRLGALGVLGSAIAGLDEYPRNCGVEVVFSANIAVPAHRRVETAKSVTLLRGKIALALYEPARGGSWTVHSMSERPTGDEVDSVIVPQGMWHAIIVSSPSIMHVTWKEYGPEDPRPAEWEPDADMLISGAPSAV